MTGKYNRERERERADNVTEEQRSAVEFWGGGGGDEFCE